MYLLSASLHLLYMEDSQQLGIMLDYQWSPRHRDASHVPDHPSLCGHVLASFPTPRLSLACKDSETSALGHETVTLDLSHDVGISSNTSLTSLSHLETKRLRSDSDRFLPLARS